MRTINADNWRHVDLVQAINNVASQIEQRAATEAAPTLHQGAGVRPVAPLTVEELVEDPLAIWRALRRGDRPGGQGRTEQGAGDGAALSQ